MQKFMYIYTKNKLSTEVMNIVDNSIHSAVDKVEKGGKRIKKGLLFKADCGIIQGL